MSWFSSPIFSLSLFLSSLWFGFFFLSLSLTHFALFYPFSANTHIPHTPHFYCIEPNTTSIIRRIIAYRIDYASRRLSSWNYCLCKTKGLSMVASQSKFSHGCVFRVRKKGCLLAFHMLLRRRLFAFLVAYHHPSTLSFTNRCNQLVLNGIHTLFVAMAYDHRRRKGGQRSKEVCTLRTKTTIGSKQAVFFSLVL